MCTYLIFFFFFQAEDGIRDLTVTGVQTCALPICAHKRITENLFKELIKAKISQVRAALADLEGAYSVADVVNRQTGEVLLEANKPLTADLWQAFAERSEEHTSELQSQSNLVCRLLLEK